jgi:hypothetical protein
MILLLIVLFLVLLAFLAEKFGYDSRGTMQSKEAELASFGMEWPGAALPMPIRPIRRRRRVRGAIARGLYAVAEWLSPGTPASLARG